MREVPCNETADVIEPVDQQIGNGRVNSFKNLTGGSGGLNPKESTYYLPLKHAGNRLKASTLAQVGGKVNACQESKDSEMVSSEMIGGGGGLNPEESTYYIPLKTTPRKKKASKVKKKVAQEGGGARRSARRPKRSPPVTRNLVRVVKTKGRKCARK